LFITGICLVQKRKNPNGDEYPKNLNTMKAMIFAAGLGTRLRPVTDHKPKALAEINGAPLLEIVIRRLILFGFKEIIVNVHHFADQVIDFLDSKKNFGINIHI